MITFVTEAFPMCPGQVDEDGLWDLLTATYAYANASTNGSALRPAEDIRAILFWY